MVWQNKSFIKNDEVWKVCLKDLKGLKGVFERFKGMLGAGALGRPRGMVWGGRREEGSG